MFQESASTLVKLEEGYEIPAEISKEYVAAGFAELKKHDEYLYTSVHGEREMDFEKCHVGMMRISWRYYPCKEASIVA